MGKPTAKMAPARTRRKAISPGVATREEIGQHHHIAGPHLGQYAGMKCRGAKTCAATPPEPNSMHVAAWHWAIRRHLRVGGIFAAAASPEGEVRQTA